MNKYLTDSEWEAWQEKIFTSWNRRCSACNGPGPLEMAHVTTKFQFQRAYQKTIGTQKSYRMDNIVPLCKKCHAAQSGYYLELEHNGTTDQDLVKDWIGRATKVAELFVKIRNLRGWTTAWQAPDEDKDITKDLL